LNLEEFIKSKLESVDDLRALLLFHGHLGAEMDANEVAGKLYLQPVTAEAVLARLATKGLLTIASQPHRYQYQPSSPEAARMVDEIVQLDRERPVSLMNLIYPRVREIKAFADAFKLTKEKEKEKEK
jgi:predicted transcriptional regulator